MKKLLIYHCTLVIVIGTIFSSCSKMEEPAENPATLQSENFEGMAAKKAGEKFNVYKGPQVQYGEGKIRSFVVLNHENFPLEIGFIITPEVFNNLEILPGFDIATAFPLHPKAKEVTPFEHLALKWSEGHPPAFFDPHFDLYFYMITNEERMAIPEYSPETEDEFTLLPPEGFMPADYGTPPGEGGAFPIIGKHWLPLNLRDYLPFNHITVLGSFNGEFIFVEPMATLDFLISDPNFSGPYSQPELFQESNNYPTRYNIYEDPRTHDVYVTLSAFVAR